MRRRQIRDSPAVAVAATANGSPGSSLGSIATTSVLSNDVTAKTAAAIPTVTSR
jgi:hypothetical protein